MGPCALQRVIDGAHAIFDIIIICLDNNSGTGRGSTPQIQMYQDIHTARFSHPLDENVDRFGVYGRT